MTGDAPTEVLGTQEAGGRALRGGVLRAGGYAAGIGLSLISAPILIRHLGIREFGRYTTVVALVAIVAGLTEGGVNTVATREAAAGRGEARRQALRTLLGLRLMVTTVGGAIAVAFGLIAGYDGVLIAGTALCAAALLTTSTQAFLAVSLQTELRFGWATAIDLARQAVTTIAIIALAVAGASLAPFFAVQLAAGAVALALTIPLVRRGFPMRPAFHPRRSWPLLRDTIPFAIATALYATYFRIGIIVMSLVASAQQTGYYATSFRVMEVLITVPLLLVTAAFPLLAHSAHENRERFLNASRRMLELSFITGIACALAVVLFAPLAIQILAGHAGRPSVPVLRIQGIALAASFLAVTAGLCLLALRHEREVLKANASALVVAALGTAAFVPLLNAQGAALATTLAEWTLAAASIWLLWRHHGRLRESLAIVPPVLAAGLVGAAPLLIPSLPDGVAPPLGLVAFLVVLKLLGQFPPEVREALGGSR